MAVVYLSLGSNIEPERHLRAAVAALRERFGALRLSRFYRSAAVGFEGEDFLNAAARIETELEPAALDAWLHALEAAHGRRRDGPRFSSRPLDIDIVLYDARISAPGETPELPRSELASEGFVLLPMLDLAPDLRHPTLGQTLTELWHAMPMERRGRLQPVAAP